MFTSKDDFSSDYNLYNPKSKGCFIVLWLYSIEPPLYYFVNEACRLRDKTVVPLLGPFLAAIAIILDGYAEGKRPDKREVGWKLEDNSPLGCMSGAFLLFRG